jgi:FkbM family methyltransferase
MKLHPSGLWYRPEAFDDIIITEGQRLFGNFPVQPGDIVLDLGAHIGVASRAALARGASKVVAVEADPSSVKVLWRNLEGYPAEVIWAAVGVKSTLYSRPDRPYLSTTLGSEEGRVAVTVPTIALSDLLRVHEPTVVKCDIEFGEYALPELRNLPAFVRLLAMELHVREDVVLRSGPSVQALRQRREEAAALLAAIEAQGFRSISRDDRLSMKPPMIEDATGLNPRTKAIDAMWVR